VVTGQQQHRAADDARLPGKVGAGPGSRRLVVLEGLPGSAGAGTVEQGADLGDRLVGGCAGTVEQGAQAGAGSPLPGGSRAAGVAAPGPRAADD
jgi:hypothetical protein